MKRRTLCMLMALCLVGALTSCGGEKEAPGGQVQSGQSSQVQTGSAEAGSDRYVFQVSSADGYTVAINDDMADVLTALGEPQSYFEAASCAFEGLDKTYTYAGFSITTRPEGEKDFVNSILLTDDSVTTPEGIYIGSSAEDVTAAYGEGGGMETVLSYTKGDTAMNFILENGKVISIEYLPA